MFSLGEDLEIFQGRLERWWEKEWQNHLSLHYVKKSIEFRHKTGSWYVVHQLWRASAHYLGIPLLPFVSFPYFLYNQKDYSPLASPPTSIVEVDDNVDQNETNESRCLDNNRLSVDTMDEMGPLSLWDRFSVDDDALSDSSLDDNPLDNSPPNGGSVAILDSSDPPIPKALEFNDSSGKKSEVTSSSPSDHSRRSPVDQQLEDKMTSGVILTVALLGLLAVGTIGVVGFFTGGVGVLAIASLLYFAPAIPAVPAMVASSLFTGVGLFGTIGEAAGVIANREVLPRFNT